MLFEGVARGLQKYIWKTKPTIGCARRSATIVHKTILKYVLRSSGSFIVKNGTFVRPSLRNHPKCFGILFVQTMRINQENTSRTKIVQSSRLVLEITSKHWPKRSLSPKTRKRAGYPWFLFVSYLHRGKSLRNSGPGKMTAIAKRFWEKNKKLFFPGPESGALCFYIKCSVWEQVWISFLPSTWNYTGIPSFPPLGIILEFLLSL